MSDLLYILHIVIINIAFYIILLLIKFVQSPWPKKFIISKGYRDEPSIYVDNKIYSNLKKRPQISNNDREWIDVLLKSIIWHGQVNNNVGNGIYELREIVRKYNIDVDEKLIEKIDDCIKVTNYGDTCILFEVRAILQHQIKSKKN